MSQSPLQLQPAPAGARRPSWIVPALILAGVALVLALILLIVAARWFVQELAKADPIPGIAIEVDAGGAVDREGVEHAARAYLQRRLREAGYDRADGAPLRIEVNFNKFGQIKYQYADQTVTADDVQLELSFFDAAGNRLKTIRQKPKMLEREEFQYDAEIGLNKTVYGRAVGQILKLPLPPPEELRAAK